MKKYIVALALMIVFSTCAESPAKVYIEINAPSARKFPVVLEDFDGEKEG